MLVGRSICMPVRGGVIGTDSNHLTQVVVSVTDVSIGRVENSSIIHKSSFGGNNIDICLYKVSPKKLDEACDRSLS